MSLQTNPGTPPDQALGQADQATSKRRRRWFVIWGLAGVVVGAIVMFIVIDIATRRYPLANPTFSDLGHGLGVFVVSPGFGGTAAFLAAAVTFAVAKQRLDFDRIAKAEEARDKQWWDLFDKMAANDSIFNVSDAGQDIALLMSQTAETELQRQAAVVLLEMYVGTAQTGAGTPGGGQQ